MAAPSSIEFAAVDLWLDPEKLVQLALHGCVEQGADCGLHTRRAVQVGFSKVEVSLCLNQVTRYRAIAGRLEASNNDLHVEMQAVDECAGDELVRELCKSAATAVPIGDRTENHGIAADDCFSGFCGSY
jgi:hypothetical protein